jgi:hypothetical protein
MQFRYPLKNISGREERGEKLGGYTKAASRPEQRNSFSMKLASNSRSMMHRVSSRWETLAEPLVV